MSKKEKKEKVVYYDDNSPIVDMSAVNKSGKRQPPPTPRQQSTFKEKWQTYWAAVKTMFKPMIVVLGILGALYFLMMWLSGNF